MRGFVLSLALIYLLTWTQADKQTHLKRVELRRRFQGRLRPGYASAISVHSNKNAQNVQADEAIPLTARSGNLEGVKKAGGRLRRIGTNGQIGLSRQLTDEGTPGARARVTRMPSSAGSPNLLASFAGKNRVLVISAPHDSDGYYRLMMSLLKPDVYCELAERHVNQIVMFHQEGEMGGKVRRITTEGKVMEEPLDTALIPRLMNFLKLEKGKKVDSISLCLNLCMGQNVIAGADINHIISLIY